MTTLRKFLTGFVAGAFIAGTISAAYAVIVGSLPYNLTNGSTADASQVMANYEAIIDDVNANGAHNGVNADITALTALSTPITVTQGGSAWYKGGTSTGSANAQTTASVTPTGMTLAAGQGVCFNAGFTNTAETTLVANSLTAKNVFRQSPSGNQALTGGEIVSGSWTCVQYDGTQYILRTSDYLAAGVGPLTSLASATGTTPGTDLGTIPSHNVNITGTNTISAFCNAASCTASTTYPVYYLKFAGILTLTYNATTLITPTAASIVTAANDTAIALYLGSGNWQVVSYTRANGTALSVANQAASQAEQEAGSVTTTYTTPGRQQFHPSAVKIWAKFAGATGTIAVSYNTTSVVRNSAGNYTVTIATDFSGADYVCTGGYNRASGSDRVYINFKNLAAGTFDMITVDSAGSADDPTAVFVECLGDQ